MNENLSKLPMNDLMDRLSDCASNFSELMMKGVNAEQFAVLRAQIEELQNEIAKRRRSATEDSIDEARAIFPSPPSASA